MKQQTADLPMKLSIKKGAYDLNIALVNRGQSDIISIEIITSDWTRYCSEVNNENFEDYRIQFQKIGWMYEYIVDNLKNEDIFIDENKNLLIRCIKKITKTQSTEKLYKINTEKVEQKEQYTLKLILTKLKKLEQNLENRQFSDGQQRRIKQMEQQIEKLKMIPKFGQKQYRFSQTLRDKSTQICQNGKLLQKIAPNQYCSTVIQNSYGLRYHNIRFKILTSNSGAIVIGLGLLDKLKKNNFIKYYGQKQSYALSQSAALLQPGKDGVGTGYAFAAGNEIEVEVRNNKITFQKNGVFTGVMSNIDFTQEQWADSCLFVAVHNVGDSVVILN